MGTLNEQERLQLLDVIDTHMRRWRKSQGVFASLQVTMRFTVRLGENEQSEELSVNTWGDRDESKSS